MGKLTDQQRTNIIWSVIIAAVIVAIVVWAGWPTTPPPAVTP